MGDSHAGPQIDAIGILREISDPACFLSMTGKNTISREAIDVLLKEVEESVGNLFESDG